MRPCGIKPCSSYFILIALVICTSNILYSIFYHGLSHSAVDIDHTTSFPPTEHFSSYTNVFDNSTTYLDILYELDELSRGYRLQELECPNFLIPFQNQIVRNDNTNRRTLLVETKIPRILHVSMKSRCMPRDIARTMDRWKKTLPNYSIFFHDDEAVANLIGQEWPEFPRLHSAMKCVLYKGAMTIDIWRVLILYKYGGVYTDIDNWPTDAFNEATIPSYLSAFFLSDGRNRPSQWFMATEPRHTMMFLSMSVIIDNVINNNNIRKPRVVFITGPNAMKDGYYLFLAPSCCNGSTEQNKVFQSDIVLTGMLNKKVLKRSKPDDIIISKKDYDEVVPYNTTLNMTRHERIILESGVLHWPRAVFLANRDNKFRNFNKASSSCAKYLKQLERGEVSPSLMF